MRLALSHWVSTKSSNMQPDIFERRSLIFESQVWIAGFVAKSKYIEAVVHCDDNDWFM